MAKPVRCITSAIALIALCSCQSNLFKLTCNLSDLRANSGDLPKYIKLTDYSVPAPKLGWGAVNPTSFDQAFEYGFGTAGGRETVNQFSYLYAAPIFYHSSLDGLFYFENSADLLSPPKELVFSSSVASEYKIACGHDPKERPHVGKAYECHYLGRYKGIVVEMRADIIKTYFEVSDFNKLVTNIDARAAACI